MLYWLEKPPALGVPPQLDGYLPLSSSQNYMVHVSTSANLLPSDSSSKRSFVIYATDEKGNRVKVKSSKVSAASVAEQAGGGEWGVAGR